MSVVEARWESDFAVLLGLEVPTFECARSHTSAPTRVRLNTNRATTTRNVSLTFRQSFCCRWTSFGYLAEGQDGLCEEQRKGERARREKRLFRCSSSDAVSTNTNLFSWKTFGKLNFLRVLSGVRKSEPSEFSAPFEGLRGKEREKAVGLKQKKRRQHSIYTYNIHNNTYTL